MLKYEQCRKAWHISVVSGGVFTATCSSYYGSGRGWTPELWLLEALVLKADDSGPGCKHSLEAPGHMTQSTTLENCEARAQARVPYPFPFNSTPLANTKHGGISFHLNSLQRLDVYIRKKHYRVTWHSQWRHAWEPWNILQISLEILQYHHISCTNHNHWVIVQSDNSTSTFLW